MLQKTEYVRQARNLRLGTVFADSQRLKQEAFRRRERNAPEEVSFVLHSPSSSRQIKHILTSQN
ncbi:hypothetical protein [Microseira sp. BLCC-F43]|uniref:hypothetical protein n=1 Tax=Microseira sp. BLCC-F43 TaxID=3153602 RepID=UPI0035B95701